MHKRSKIHTISTSQQSIHNQTPQLLLYFFFNNTPTTHIYTLSLHDALPISRSATCWSTPAPWGSSRSTRRAGRSEEHTSELQSHSELVCRLLLEKKKEPRCERSRS